MTRHAASSPLKKYRGSSADERRRERRTQLIKAAVKVYGERGYRNATVKSVCDTAGLTERYFYESFSNSGDLLVASFRAVTHVLLEEIRDAGARGSSDPVRRIRAMLTACYEALQRDPASARVFLVEIRGFNAEIDEILNETLHDFGQLLTAPWGARADVSDLIKSGIAGAVIQIALVWIAGEYAQPLSEIVNAALYISCGLRSS